MTEVLTDTSELQKFDPVRAWATARKQEFMPLKINGIDDKAGYDAVHKARIIMRDKRIEVEKMRKAIKRYYIDKGTEVDNKAKEITGILDPIETHLKAQEDAIDAEKESIRIRKEREKALPGRKDQLAALNITIPDEILLGMDDNVFNENILKERQAILDAKEKEQKEKEAALAAEREKIDAEKRAEEEKKRIEERIEREKTEAAEKAVAEEKAKQKKVEAERIAAEEKARAEAEAAPDKEKLKSYVNALLAVPVPTIKSPKYHNALTIMINGINEWTKLIK